jgi:predicted esterase
VTIPSLESFHNPTTSAGHERERVLSVVAPRGILSKMPRIDRRYRARLSDRGRPHVRTSVRVVGALSLGLTVVACQRGHDGDGTTRPVAVTRVPEPPKTPDAAAQDASADCHQMQLLDFGEKYPAAWYPPCKTGTHRPVLVMLHGMCALPQYECPVFSGDAQRTAWLLCPPGPVTCKGAGAMWTGSPTELSAVIARALTALKQTHPDVNSDRKALVGYSLGASAALAIASHSGADYRGLLLLNAGLSPDPRAMKRAGIARVALVAGDRDMSRQKLRQAAKLLAASDFDARFFSLERTGHFFDASSPERVVASLAWLAEVL